MIFEEKLIYFPEQYPSGDWAPTLAAGVMLEDVWFDSGHCRLHGWYLTSENGDAEYVYLICHGNAGNITSRFAKAQEIAKLGISVLLFDYRGYGKSDVSPLGEEAIYEDVSSAMRFLSDRGFAEEKVIVHGISLGGGAASYLSEKFGLAGLVLESTFTSIPDMCTKLYPYIPRFLVGTQFNNIERVSKVKVPALVFHGTEDQLIPHWMGVKLFEAMTATEDKNFIAVEKAGHSDLLTVAGDEYTSSIDRLLTRIKT